MASYKKFIIYSNFQFFLALINNENRTMKDTHHQEEEGEGEDQEREIWVKLWR